MLARLLLALTIALTAGVANAASTTVNEVAAHVGEYATVCGQVASTNYASQANGQPTFLDMGRAYPKQLFTVVIRKRPGQVRIARGVTSRQGNLRHRRDPALSGEAGNRSSRPEQSDVAVNGEQRSGAAGVYQLSPLQHEVRTKSAIGTAAALARTRESSAKSGSHRSVRGSTPLARDQVGIGTPLRHRPLAWPCQWIGARRSFAPSSHGAGSRLSLCGRPRQIREGRRRQCV